MNERNDCPYEKDYLVCNLPKRSKLHDVQKYMDIAITNNQSNYVFHIFLHFWFCKLLSTKLSDVNEWLLALKQQV